MRPLAKDMISLGLRSISNVSEFSNLRSSWLAALSSGSTSEPLGMVTPDLQRLVVIKVGANPVGLTTNVPKAEITGLEVDSQVNPVDWLTLGASFAYAYAIPARWPACSG